MVEPEPSAAHTCDSCGSPDDELEGVRRVYVVPEAWDTAASETKVDDIEHWCFPCRSMYPHEPTG